MAFSRSYLYNVSMKVQHLDYRTSALWNRRQHQVDGDEAVTRLE